MKLRRRDHPYEWKFDQKLKGIFLCIFHGWVLLKSYKFYHFLSVHKQICIRCFLEEKIQQVVQPLNKFLTDLPIDLKFDQINRLYFELKLMNNHWFEFNLIPSLVLYKVIFNNRPLFNLLNSLLLQIICV